MALTGSSFAQQDLESAIWRVNCAEPFDADIKNGQFAFGTGSEVRIGRPNEAVQVIEYDWLSFVHTVEFSADGKRLLVSSAGFDTILEFDTETAEVMWEWNGWDNGFNRAAVESRFITRLHEQVSGFAEQYGRDAVVHVKRPEWPPEGIPTPLSPLRINGASYGEGNSILATSYHRPELLLISRGGGCRLENLELRHPHSFQRVRFLEEDRYWVADSGRGRVLVLDNDFRVVEWINFAVLDADEKKREGFGEWLQTIEIIHLADGDLVFAVDALRVGVHVLDVERRRRRFIPYPEHWTVQTVIPQRAIVPLVQSPAPVDREPHQRRRWK